MQNKRNEGLKFKHEDTIQLYFISISPTVEHEKERLISSGMRKNVMKVCLVHGKTNKQRGYKGSAIGISVQPFVLCYWQHLYDDNWDSYSDRRHIEIFIM